MKEKDKRTINIVIHYCNRMEDYSNRFNNDKEIYLSDKLYQDACALVIIQIGEFVGRLSDEFRDNHQEINWQEIIGMRNIFAHNYEDVIDDQYTIVVKSKVLPALSLGYNKITVESPVTDEDGRPIFKKGKMQADPSKRDTEKVPLDEDMDEYFKREVLPYKPNSWIDHSKDKIGYEIPFTKTFYEYLEMEPSDVIEERIEVRKKRLIERLYTLFGGEQDE